MNTPGPDEGLRSELSKQGIFTDELQETLQLGPKKFRLAAAVRPGLLRHRDDRRLDGAL